MTGPRSLSAAVERRAEADADGELVRVAGGPAISAGELLENAKRLAGHLASVVGPGATVATAVPTGPDAIALTTAISWLGAVELPIPLGLDPNMARMISESARTATTVAAPDRLRAEPHLTRLGGHVHTPSLTMSGGLDGMPRLDELPSQPLTTHRATLETPSAIMVTSGTGGRPRGALLPNGSGLGQAKRVARAMGYGADDVLYNVFAWQHVNARHAGFLTAVLSGSRLVIDDFSVSRFWDTVAREDVTAFNFMGAVCAMLLRRPPAPTDRRHSVRQAYGGPAPAWLHGQMLERFGVELRQAYACTELGDVATTGHEVRPGAAGRVVPEYELRVVDDDGAPLSDRSIGVVQVRPRKPSLTFTEYIGDPAATRAAWSDGWFATGDRGHLDNGWFHHEGRAADVIRRRGLTIDAEHLEQIALQHPAVEQAAAVGVPSELTDDEVLLVVVPRPGANLDPSDVRQHCAAHLPRHAVPRFVSIEPSLPRTGSLKIVHRALRDRGLPSSVWDAEASVTPEENP